MAFNLTTKNMHLDKFNRTLIRIKPEKNINCLPIYIKDLRTILDERKILSSLNLSINSDDVTVIMGPNGRKEHFLKNFKWNFNTYIRMHYME